MSVDVFRPGFASPAEAIDAPHEDLLYTIALHRHREFSNPTTSPRSMPIHTDDLLSGHPSAGNAWDR